MATYVFKSDQYGTHKLDYLPIGWDKFTRTFERSKEWHSVNPYYNINLEFIEDGADYLIGAYEDGGLEAQVYLDIYLDDEQDLIHKPTPVRCKIDFSTYNVNYQKRVKVDIERIGFAQKIKNSERVKIDLTNTRPLEGDMELPPLPFKSIDLHSKGILKLSEMIHEKGEESYPHFIWTRTSVGSNTNQSYSKYLQVSTSNKIADEIEASYTYQNNYSSNIRPTDITPLDGLRFSYKIVEAGQTTLNVNIDLTVIIEWHGHLVQNSYLTIKRVRGGVEEDLSRSLITSYGNTGGDNNTGTASNPRKKTIQLQKATSIIVNNEVDDYIYIYIENEVVHTGIKVQDYIGNAYDVWQSKIDETFTVNSYSIKATSLTTVPGSTATGIPFADAFSRAIESLTGEVGSFDNSFYALSDSYNKTATTDKLAGRRMLLNGIHVRGWDLNEKPLTVTFADLFKTAHVLDVVGFGIKQEEGKFKAYIAPIKDFYKDEVILHLGEVSKLEKTVSLDTTYNTVEVGYNKYDTDSTNSLDEFNGSRKYKTSIPHTNNYEAVAPLRSDGYGLETARRQSRLANPNKSTNYDKDTFIVCFKRQSGKIVSENGSLFLSSTNLIDPVTSYNVRISPARILRKHEQLFAGCLQKSLDKDLKFTDGEVNIDMVSRISGESAAIPESGDRKNDTLQKPVFLNEIYEFEKVLTDEQISLLEKDPHGTISFVDGDESIKYGYLDKVEIQYNRLSRFTLLRKYING